MAIFNNDRVDIWGKGGLFEQRLEDRMRAGQPQDQGPMSIIGGQLVAGGDVAGRNEASTAFNERAAYDNAYQQMRDDNPTGVRRGQPGGLASPMNNLGQAEGLRAPGGAFAPPFAAAGGPAMNGDAVYPGGPSFASTLKPPQTTSSSSNTPTSFAGLRGYGDESENGMRNGGMVNKQRMVKQPGYKSGGKVKMPGQPCGMRGYQRGGPVTDDWQYVENVDGEMREVPKPVVDRGERGFRNDPKASILTNTMRRVAHGAKQKSKKDDKSKDGMMAGGQIGDEMQDDGKDTIEIGVREGEYLVTPEGTEVIGSMVGGEAEDPYTNGVAFLDQANQAGTGEEPGPVPINEAGEEVQQGMRNGGAGIRARARAAADAAAERARLDRVAAQEARWSQAPQPESVKATEIPEGAREKAAKQNAKFDAKAAKANATKVKPGFRGALSGKHTTSVGDVFKGAGRSVKNVARGGPGLLRGTAPVAGLAGAWQGFQTPTEDYVERMGIDYPETLLGELGVRSAGVLSDVGTAFIDPFIELGNLATGNEVPTLRSNFADVQAADGSGASIPAQLMGANEFAPTEAGATAPPPPPPAADPYGRAFGAGNVDLNNAGLRNARAEVAPGGMNVVQNTGGPDGEVIVREDINGVPTFTNLRRGGFDGSPRNLQAQADARAAQDVGIRQMQAQAVQQMRDNAPIYDQEGVDQRRAEELGLQETAMQAAGRRGSGSSKVDKLRKKVSGHFSQQGTDENGNLTGPVEDITATQTFIDAMSQLIDPATGRPMTEVMDGMSEGEMAPYLEEFDRVYRNTQMAMQAGKAQDRPVDDNLRAGVDELRLQGTPNNFREVVLGDVPGPEATIGDWWEGLGNDDPARNRYVVDPRSGAVIPASRVTRNGLDADSMRKLGLLD